MLKTQRARTWFVGATIGFSAWTGFWTFLHALTIKGNFDYKHSWLWTMGVINFWTVIGAIGLVLAYFLWGGFCIVCSFVSNRVGHWIDSGQTKSDTEIRKDIVTSAVDAANETRGQ